MRLFLASALLAAAPLAGFAAPAMLDHHRDIEAHQRAQVGDAAAVAAHDLHRLPLTADRGHHLLDARILAARIGVDLGQHRGAVAERHRR